MKLKIENYEYFDGEGYNFWFMVKNVGEKYEKIGRAIDGENYSEKCFELWVKYFDEDDLYVVTEADGEEMCYIDNYGDRHWFHCEEANDLLQQAAIICKNELEKDI